MNQKSFPDDENKRVFTSRFVVKKKELITYVAHESDDGAWQFYSESQYNSFKDIRVVPLKTIIALDKTILEIADLPRGFEAIREKKDGEWLIQELQAFR